MNLQDLYTRVVETTGLQVITPESLCVAVRSCYADLTARNYRQFKEGVMYKSDFIRNEAGLVEFYTPSDYRRMAYVKVLGQEQMKFAARVGLANHGVQSRYDTTVKGIRSDFTRIGSEAIYYLKDNRTTLEFMDMNFKPEVVFLGYYSKLEMPPVITDEALFSSVLLDIRTEYEDALTLYVCYFYYSRFIKDPERIDFYLKQYKYFVEDISHELSSEDMFNEDNLVIPFEE